MRLDPRILSDLECSFQPDAYIRITPTAFASTPLGLGYGRTRFASPSGSFQALYIAENLQTAIAEAIIRDRFQSRVSRRISETEVERWSAVEVAAMAPLRLIDIRTTGLLRLGVSTNAMRAKSQRGGRSLSEAIYKRTQVDGILYLSRLTSARCCAIYDRGVPKLASARVLKVIELPNLVSCLAALNVALIPQT